MPVGSFSVKLKTTASTAQKSVRVKAPVPAICRELHITLVGRNMSIILDYLCGLYQNASTALQEEGLAFFTTELETISAVVSRKNALDMLFWEGGTFWKCQEQNVNEKDYTFCITPAGRQDQMLRLCFHCSCPCGHSGPQEKRDLLWLLADGALYDERVSNDSYLNFAAAQIAAGHVDCVILSQVEHIAHVSGNTAGKYSLTDQKKLFERAQDVFGEACSDNLLYPVQMYGGLEYQRMDDDGVPVLCVGRSNHFRSYEPRRCHFPLFHCLLRIINQPSELNLVEYELMQGIHAYFGKNMELSNDNTENCGGEVR